MYTHIYDFKIRALVCKERDEYVAHALEMDLVGAGSTEKEALKELLEMIECQISFASQMKDDSLLLFPAEKGFFDRWEKAHDSALKREVIGDTSIKLNAKAVVFSFTEKELAQLLRSRFKPVSGCAEAA